MSNTQPNTASVNTNSNDELDIEQFIPDEGDVIPTGNYPKSWSVYACHDADASKREIAFVTGSIEKGTRQSKEKIVGTLEEIGEITYHKKDGGLSQHFYVGIRTKKDGLIRLQTWLSDSKGNLNNPSGMTLSLAHAALQFQKHEAICLTLFMGDERNKSTMKFPTYLNAFHVKPDYSTERVAKREKSDLDISVVYGEIRKQLTGHSAWVEPKTIGTESAKSDLWFAKVQSMMEERSWPTPKDKPSVWLTAITAMFDGAVNYNTIRDVPEGAWAQIYDAFLPLEKVPSVLQGIKL
jgi:hypothetical protein